MTSAMRVILMENVSRLGRVGDVVAVKGGFGRNYLIPQQKAVRATKVNVKEFEVRRDALEAQDKKQQSAAEKAAKTLENVRVKIVRQASEDGKLYGSVSVRDIAKALEEAGHAVERRHIDLNTAIKTLGRYEATVSLHSDVRVPFVVDVVRSLEASLLEDEAEEAATAKAAEAKAAADTAEVPAAEEPVAEVADADESADEA